MKSIFKNSIIAAALLLGAASNAGSYLGFIYVNNVESGEGTLWLETVNQSSSWTVSAMRIMYFNVGDVFDFRIMSQSSGTSISRASVQVAKISN